MAEGAKSNYLQHILTLPGVWQHFRFGDVAKTGYVPTHFASVPDHSGNGRHGNWWNPGGQQNLSYALVGDGQGYPSLTGQLGEFSDNPPDMAFRQAYGTTYGEGPYYAIVNQPIVLGSSRTYSVWFWREAVNGGLGMIFAQDSTPLSGQSGAYCCAGGQFGYTDRTLIFAPGGNSATAAVWTDILPVATGGLVHLVINYNASANTAEAFVNGESKGSLTVGAAQSYNAANALRFGVWAAVNSYVNYPWFGFIDEWTVFEPTLSAATIRRLYAIGIRRQRGMFF